MSSTINRLNSLFEKAPNTLLPWRWPVLTIYVLSTAIMLWAIAEKFTMDMSLETWFKEDDPVRVTLQDFRQQFGSDDGLYVVYEPLDGDVFSKESIKTLAKLHNAIDDARVARGEAASQLNRIDRIDSLYNIRLQKVDGDTLIAQKLLATDFPTNKEEREAKRALALDQDTFKLAYYSEDFRYGGIRIKTDFGTVPKQSESELALAASETEVSLLDDDYLEAGDGDNLLTDNSDSGILSDDEDQFGEIGVDESFEVEKIEYEATQMDEYLLFMKDLRKITETDEYNHFKIYYSGNAPMMEFAMENFAQAGVLMGIMIVIFIVLLWILFHSFSAVLWSIIVIATCAIWSVGFFALIGVTLSNMVSLTIMLILAVGIADCVHVLSTYTLYRREGENHRDAMTQAYRKTGVPIFLTTLTTMAGMCALLISDIPQIGTFGVNSAFGVFMAFIMTIFVFPILLDIWHPYVDANGTNEKPINEKNEPEKNWLYPFLKSLPAFTEKHAKLIVAFYLVMFGIFVYGTSIIKVDSNFTELTRKGSVIRVTADIVDTHMMGGQNMEVMLDFGKPDALKDPKVLKAIDTFQTHIVEAYPQYMVKSFSLADQVKETNKVMNENQESFKRIPDDPRMAAQLLYMFNNSNPDDRRNLVSDDYSISHISIQLKNAGSHEYTDVFDNINADIERIFMPLKDQYGDVNTQVTGALPLMMKLVDHMSWAQIKSFSLAIVIISLFLIISLNSLRGGLISIIPNVMPAILTFGLMGLMGIALDTDTLIIAPLIIGIAVDDTIHFMAHYRDAWYRTGDRDESLRETIMEVGQAVTFTTIILASGFAVLSFSDYLGIAKTGFFGSLSILVALSCDLLLLPASIVLLKPDLGRKRFVEKMLDEPEALKKAQA